MDLARTFRFRNAPVDEPLRHLVADARAIKTEITDNIYVRILDVAAALRQRRYQCEVDLVIDIRDDLLPGNNGPIRLRGGAERSTVTKAKKATPDISLGILELGAIYLGGVRLSDLQRAGRVAEHTPGAVELIDQAFAGQRQPWCPDHF